MLNLVHLIGHLGRDPELKYAANDNPVCTFSVATDEGYTDKDGTKVERTEWHSVVAYQRLAETCGQYIHKGSKVYIQGKLQTRKWQDKNGNDRYTTEIIASLVKFLDSKGAEQGQDSKSQARQAATAEGPALPSEAAGMGYAPF